MASGRQDSLIRGSGAAAVVAAPKVSTFAAVPPPTIHTGVTVLAPRVAAVASIPTVGAGDPTPFPMQNVFGANSLYDNAARHTGIPEMSVRDSGNYADDQLAAAISRPGRILAGPHVYSGSSWPSTYAASAGNWADDDGYSWLFLNVKTGLVSSWIDLRNGTGGWTDAFINNFIDSVPNNIRLCFTVNHEPENDGTQPNGDGGTWELTNADNWCRGVARVANLVAARNRPNVVFLVCHQATTFPTNGLVPGATGVNGRVTARWNPWQYMTPAAQARTVFAPDGYADITDDFALAQTGTTASTLRATSTAAAAFSVGDRATLETTGGVMLGSDLYTITSKTAAGSFVDLAVTPSFFAVPSPSLHRLRCIEPINKRFDGCYAYVDNAGWGVQWVGVFEFTWNNNVLAPDGVPAACYRYDLKPWLRTLRDIGRLGCFVAFNHSDPNGASGSEGWWDSAEEFLQVARIAWEMNTGEVV